MRGPGRDPGPFLVRSEIRSAKENGRSLSWPEGRFRTLENPHPNVAKNATLGWAPEDFRPSVLCRGRMNTRDDGKSEKLWDSNCPTGIHSFIDFDILLCENPRERLLLRGNNEGGGSQLSLPADAFRTVTRWIFFNIMGTGRDCGSRFGPA